MMLISNISTINYKTFLFPHPKMTQQSRHELMHVPEMFKEFLLNMEHLFPAVVIRQIYYK